MEIRPAAREFESLPEFVALSPEEKIQFVELVSQDMDENDRKSFIDRGNRALEQSTRADGTGRLIRQEKIGEVIQSVLPTDFNELGKESQLEAIEKAREVVEDKALEVDPVNRNDTAYFADVQLGQLVREVQKDDVGDFEDKFNRFTGGVIQSVFAPISEQGTREFLEMNLPTNPDYDTTAASKLTQAAGDFVGQIGQFFAISALATPATAIGVGFAQNALRKFQENYDMAKGEMGLDDDAALAAGIAGVPGAVIDSLGDALLLKGIKLGSLSKSFKSMTAAEKAAEIVKKGGSVLRDPSMMRSITAQAAKGAILEGTSEALGDAATGWGGYATSGHEGFKPSAESLWDSFWIGGVLGGLAGGALNSRAANRDTKALRQLGQMNQEEFLKLGEETQQQVASFMDSGDYTKALELVNSFKQKVAPTPDQPEPASQDQQGQQAPQQPANEAQAPQEPTPRTDVELAAARALVEDAVAGNLDNIKFANESPETKARFETIRNAVPTVMKTLRALMSPDAEFKMSLDDVTNAINQARIPSAEPVAQQQPDAQVDRKEQVRAKVDSAIEELTNKSDEPIPDQEGDTKDNQIMDALGNFPSEDLPVMVDDIQTINEEYQQPQAEGESTRDSLLRRVDRMESLARYKGVVLGKQASVNAAKVLATSLRNKINTADDATLGEVSAEIDQVVQDGRVINQDEVNEMVSKLQERGGIADAQATENIEQPQPSGMLFQGAQGTPATEVNPLLTGLTPEQLDALESVVNALRELGIDETVKDADRELAMEIRKAVATGTMSDELNDKLNANTPSRAIFHNKLMALKGFGETTKRNVMMQQDVIALNYLKTGKSMQAYWAKVPDVIVIDEKGYEGAQGALASDNVFSPSEAVEDAAGIIRPQAVSVSDETTDDRPASLVAPIPNTIVLVRGAYNASTLIHENDHNLIATGMVQEILDAVDPALHDELLAELGLQRGQQWTIGAHEKFARAREAWIRGGEVKSIFKKVFDALKGIFTNLYADGVLDKFRNPVLEKAFAEIYSIQDLPKKKLTDKVARDYGYEASKLVGHVPLNKLAKAQNFIETAKLEPSYDAAKLLLTKLATTMDSGTPAFTEPEHKAMQDVLRMVMVGEAPVMAEPVIPTSSYVRMTPREMLEQGIITQGEYNAYIRPSTFGLNPEQLLERGIISQGEYNAAQLPSIYGMTPEQMLASGIITQGEYNLSQMPSITGLTPEQLLERGIISQGEYNTFQGFLFQRVGIDREAEAQAEEKSDAIEKIADYLTPVSPEGRTSEQDARVTPKSIQKSIELELSPDEIASIASEVNEPSWGDNAKIKAIKLFSEWLNGLASVSSKVADLFARVWNAMKVAAIALTPTVSPFVNEIPKITALSDQQPSTESVDFKPVIDSIVNKVKKSYRTKTEIAQDFMAQAEIPAETRNRIQELSAMNTSMDVVIDGYDDFIDFIESELDYYRTTDDFSSDELETNVINPDGGNVTINKSDMIRIGEQIAKGLKDKKDLIYKNASRIVGIVSDITGQPMTGYRIKIKKDILIDAAVANKLGKSWTDASINKELTINLSALTLVGLASTDQNVRASSASTLANELAHVAQQNANKDWSLDKPVLPAGSIKLSPVVSGSFSEAMKIFYRGTRYPSKEMESFEISYLAGRAFIGSTERMASDEKIREIIEKAVSKKNTMIDKENLFNNLKEGVYRSSSILFQMAGEREPISAGANFIYGLAPYENGRIGKHQVAKNGKVSEQQFIRVAKGTDQPLKSAEMEFYKYLVPSAFEDGMVDLNVLQRGLENNPPVVQTYVYGQGGSNEIKDQRDAMSHDWYETHRSYVRGLINDYVDAVDADAVIQVDDPEYLLEQLRGEGVDIEKLNKWAELNVKMDGQPDARGPIATSHYNAISPFDPYEYPVVRIDVALPATSLDNEIADLTKKELDGKLTTKDIQRIEEIRSIEAINNPFWMQDDLHENLPNTIGWAMVQFVPDPKTGEVVMFVGEQQSRWGQEVRRIKAQEKEEVERKMSSLREYLSQASAIEVFDSSIFVLDKDGKNVPRQPFYTMDVIDQIASELGKGLHQITPELAQRIQQQSELEMIRSMEQSKIEYGTTPSHPLLDVQHEIVLKSAITEAQKRGVTKMVISDSETAMMTEVHDKRISSKEKFNTKKQAEQHADKLNDELGEDGAFFVESDQDSNWRVVLDDVDGPRIDLTNKALELGFAPLQAGGMKLHYDSTLPAASKKITGDKGRFVEMGTHKNASMLGQERNTIGSPVFRNPDGTPKSNVTGRMYDLSKFNAESVMLFQKAGTQVLSDSQVRSSVGMGLAMIDLMAKYGDSKADLKDLNKVRKDVHIVIDSYNKEAGKSVDQKAVQKAARRLINKFQTYYESFAPEYADRAYLIDTAVAKSFAIEDFGIQRDSLNRANNIKNQQGLTDSEEQKLRMQRLANELRNTFRNARNTNSFINAFTQHVSPPFRAAATRIAKLMTRGVDNIMGAFNETNFDLLERFVDNIKAYKGKQFDNSPEFIEEFQKTISDVEEEIGNYLTRQFKAYNSVYMELHGIDSEIDAMIAEMKQKKEGETAIEHYNRIVKAAQAIEARMFNLEENLAGTEEGQAILEKRKKTIRAKREKIGKLHQQSLMEKHPTFEDYLKYRKEKDGAPLYKMFEDTLRMAYDTVINAKVEELSDADIRLHNSMALTLMVGGNHTNLLVPMKRAWQAEKIESWKALVNSMRDRVGNNPLVRPIYRSAARNTTLKKLFNTLDKSIQAKVENFHIWIDRLSQYAPVRAWFDQQFFAMFQQGTFTEAEKTKDSEVQWWQERIKEYNDDIDTTANANPYLWVMTTLGQYNISDDPNKTFKKYVTKARTSIARMKQKNSSSMMTNLADRNLAALDFMLKDIDLNSDTAYDQFMKLAETRIGENNEAVAQKRMKLLRDVVDHFQLDIANQIFVREVIHGKEFTTVVNYMPLQTMNADGSPEQFDWTDLEPAQERLPSSKNVNANTNESRKLSLGQGRAYGMDFFNMIERKLVKNAIDKHSQLPVAILADMFRTELKIIDGAELRVPVNEVTKEIFGTAPEVAGELDTIKEKITHQLIQVYGLTEPPSAFTSGIKKVLATVQAGMLSGVGQVGQQVAAAGVDYMAREEGNVSYLFDAIIYWSKNYSKVREWLLKNNPDLYRRGDTQGIIEFERHLNNAGSELGSMLDKAGRGFDEMRKFATLSLRYGDKLGAEWIFLAEHMKAVRNDGKLPAGAEYNIEDFTNVKYTTTANGGMARYIGTSSAAGRSYWMSDHKQSYFMLRSLTGAFQSSAHNMSSQILAAARNYVALQNDNSEQGKQERRAELRRIGSIMAQQATFTGVRHVIGAMMTYALVGAIKDAYDDEEGVIAKAELELARVKKTGYPTQEAKNRAVAEAERKLADARTIRRAVTTMKQQASTDGLFKSMVRDQLQNLHIVGSVGDGMVAKWFMMVPNIMAEQSHREAQDLVIKGLQRQKSEAIAMGDREKAAKISESITDARAIEYIPFFYEKKDKSGFGGIIGGALDPIYSGLKEGFEDVTRADRDFLTTRAFVPDLITYMSALGVGQADANRIAKQLQRIDDELSKNREEINKRAGEEAAKLTNKSPKTFILKELGDESKPAKSNKKVEIGQMIGGYRVASADELGLVDFFKKRKDVAGMAWGGGANGTDPKSERVLVYNPYNEYMKDESRRQGLLVLEAARHEMDKNPVSDYPISEELQKWRELTFEKGNPYREDDKAFRETVVSRALVGDTGTNKEMKMPIGDVPVKEIMKYQHLLK